MTQPLTEALAAWLEGHTLAVSSGDEMVCACGEWAEFESLQQPSHAEHVASRLAPELQDALDDAVVAAQKSEYDDPLAEADEAFVGALQRSKGEPNGV
jgi:hypothetical protein